MYVWKDMVHNKITSQVSKNLDMFTLWEIERTCLAFWMNQESLGLWPVSK